MKTMMLTTCACTLVLFLGCGEDEKTAGHTGGTGGKASGGTAGTGGKATGGTGGSTGGTSGSGGTSTGGGTGGIAGGAGDAAAPVHLLVGGTDFFSKTEIATIDVTAGTRVGGCPQRTR